MIFQWINMSEERLGLLSLWMNVNPEDQVWGDLPFPGDAPHPSSLNPPNQRARRGRSHGIVIVSEVNGYILVLWLLKRWSLKSFLCQSSILSCISPSLAPTWTLFCAYAYRQHFHLPSEPKFSEYVCISWRFRTQPDFQIVSQPFPSGFVFIPCPVKRKWLEMTPWILSRAMPLTPMYNHTYILSLWTSCSVSRSSSTKP